MRVNGGHLTYCSNIHPGERWAEHFAALAEALPAVRREAAPGVAFGIGLRLSAAAARDLGEPERLAAWEGWLAAEGCYLFTLNGFPYGRFHQAAVKAQVYRPDWRSPARLAYTLALGRLLARLLPADVEYGSISSVPVGYRADFADEAALAAAARGLLAAVAGLIAIERESGRTLVLALEPEPGCVLERCADAVAFFGRHLLGAQALGELARLADLGSAAAAEAALRRHLGVCLDTCHAAVMHEPLAEAVALLAAAGIRLAKIQLSAGLRIPALDEAALAQLSAFIDPVYLHQVSERGPAGLALYPDLPEAFAAAVQGRGREWRVHFHVPLDADRPGGLASTRDELIPLLARQRRQPLTAHLEVETYTFDALPPELRARPRALSIARELQWVQERLA